MKKKSIFNQISATKLLLCCVFILFVFYPFFQMVINIDFEDFKRVVSSASFIPATINSLKVAATTTVISVFIGLILAFCMQRTRIKGKDIFSVLLILPMLIPSISHGMGLIVMFGTNGFITKLLELNSTIYGFSGIIVGSVLYSYPVAFLMFNDVLKYQDSSPYEAAVILGIPKIRRTTAITLSYLKRPLISAIFTVFTMVVTDYGIPLMIGGKTTTLAVMMYQEVLGQLDFGKGSVIGLLLLIPAVITFLFNTFFKKSAKMGYVTKPFELKKNPLRDVFAYLTCGTILASIIMLIVSFAVVAFTVKYPSDMTFTFDNISKMIKLRGDTYLLNSLIIAVCVAFIGSVVAFITAYLTARIPSKLSQCLHLFSITSLAIPGLVLGLSYSLTFSGSFIYGTLAILILANLMHFFASPYQMMYNSLLKMNENLENVGQTLGVSRFRIIIDVVVPQCKYTLFEMFYYFFVNSMMTISAVSFLANMNTKPISLMIGQFEAQMLYECAAVISLIILIANVMAKIIVTYVTRIATKKTKNTH